MIVLLDDADNWTTIDTRSGIGLVQTRKTQKTRRVIISRTPDESYEPQWMQLMRLFLMAAATATHSLKDNVDVSSYSVSSAVTSFDMPLVFSVSP